MFKFEKLLLYIKNGKSLYFQMSNLAAVYFIFIEVFFLFNVLFFYNIIEYRLLKTKEATGFSCIEEEVAIYTRARLIMQITIRL